MNAVAIAYYQIFGTVWGLEPFTAIAVLCAMVRMNGILGRS